VLLHCRYGVRAVDQHAWWMGWNAQQALAVQSQCLADHDRRRRRNTVLYSAPDSEFEASGGAGGVTGHKPSQRDIQLFWGVR